MRQIRQGWRSPLQFLLATFLGSSSAFAVPVYLTPDSVFPTGHYNREWLKTRTSAQLTQRWLKVRSSSGAVGWVAEDHVLSKLLLSAYGRTQTATSLRAEMRMDGREVTRLPAGARVRLLGRTGRWFEAQADGTKLTGFIPSDLLRPDLESAQMAFIKERVHLHEQANLRSETVVTIDAGERAEVVRLVPPWAFVRLGNKSGYIGLAKVILRDQIEINSVLALWAGLPLRADSLPFAKAVRRAERLERLHLADSRIESWGRVALKNEGDVWWPMSIRARDPEEQPSATVRLKTSVLFQRKIFDMAASPAKPNIKFASADGVFRTTDGREWIRIDLFKNQNQPISFSPSGRVFIGPYVSDDHGQTFREYIRWDTLVKQIRERWDPAEHNLRILEVKPTDWRGQHVELKLDIGLDKDIRITTETGQF